MGLAKVEEKEEAMEMVLVAKNVVYMESDEELEENLV